MITKPWRINPNNAGEVGVSQQKFKKLGELPMIFGNTVCTTQRKRTEWESE